MCLPGCYTTPPATPCQSPAPYLTDRSLPEVQLASETKMTTKLYNDSNEEKLKIKNPWYRDNVRRPSISRSSSCNIPSVVRIFEVVSKNIRDKNRLGIAMLFVPIYIRSLRLDGRLFVHQCMSFNIAFRICTFTARTISLFLKENCNRL